MSPKGETLDVLEHEGVGLEFGDKTDELLHKLITGVIQVPLPDKGKPLAGRTAKDYSDTSAADACGSADFSGGQTDDRPYDGRRLREVEVVSGGVDGVDFNRSSNVESGLLEAEGESASAGEKINSERAVSHPKTP
jgi:hypothetical protein